LPNLIQELSRLPDDWGFVAVGQGKRPYQSKWQKNPLSKADITTEINSGRAVAIGVIAGPQSGGLLFVDHDGISAGEVLKQLGTSIADLPKSWAVTSGRDGRLQIIYTVPTRYWSAIQTRKIKSGKFDSEGKPEQLELRWTGCQSVVAGSHPITGAYRWLKNRAPDDLPLAEAPLVLLEAMLPQDPEPQPAPLLAPPPKRSDDDWARIWLDALSPSRANTYDEWIEVGQCLHSVGDHLLADWDRWSSQSAKYKPTDCAYHWGTFQADGKRDIRHLCNLAKQDGWKPKQTRNTTPTKAAASNASTSTADPLIKPQKLEAKELLAMLRQPAPDGSPRFRYNIFSQQIELDGKVKTGIERFYIELAEQGHKISKEVAMDCLIQVANENQYDPVKLYLEHVETQIKPTYIDRLASTYLRPEDAALPEPTLYDCMIKKTLIAAVRRIFEPGSKHDYACVLMGEQGARKSSFWSAMGGPFFSDSLRDTKNKDDLMILHRSWIMEMGELDRITTKTHAGDIKQFLSQSTDIFRVPYGKATEAFPRRCIIVGSTNRTDGFLVDETGNRRFWVVPVTCTIENPIDVPNLLLERDAIWSAAVAAYKAGEAPMLSTQQETQVAEQNDGYVVVSPWLVSIQSYLRHRRSIEPLTSEEVLTHAVQKPIERQTRADQMQVATILKSLGWDKRRVSIESRRTYVWDQPSLAKVRQ